MSTTLVYPIGSIINFTYGEHSDFGNVGLAVTLVKLDLRAAAKEYMETGPKGDWKDRPAPEDFPSWLVSKQYTAPVAAPDVWLGDYLEFNWEIWSPSP